MEVISADLISKENRCSGIKPHTFVQSAAGEDMELKEAAAEFEKIEKRLESVMPDVFKH